MKSVKGLLDRLLRHIEFAGDLCWAPKRFRQAAESSAFDLAPAFALLRRAGRAGSALPRCYFGVGEATSFWKRGSFRSGSNIGSSRSNAGVSGSAGKGTPYGIESSYCKAAMARSGS